MNNIRDLSSGKLMISPGPHGNWDYYKDIIKKFEFMKENGSIDTLVLAGDIILEDGKSEDKSLKILDDLIYNHDPTDVISLLGDHELRQIYSLDIHKGIRFFKEKSQVKSLDEQFGVDRQVYLDYIKNMPYAIRTSGGVIINHTGAPSVLSNPVIEINENDKKKRYSTFDIINLLKHDNFLNYLATNIEAKTGNYNKIDIKKYNPELGKEFLRNPLGKILWDIYFDKNELEHGKEYGGIITGYLRNMISDLNHNFKSQSFIVSANKRKGLMPRIVRRQQIRVNEESFAIVGAAEKYVSAGQINTRSIYE